MISKLAHLAIEVANEVGVSSRYIYEAQPGEIEELDKELRDTPMLANPMLQGFAWNYAPNMPFVLIFGPEDGVAVTICVLNPLHQEDKDSLPQLPQ